MTNPTNANHISRASSWLSSCQYCTSKTTRPNCATTTRNSATLATCCRTDFRHGGALAVVSLSSSRWSAVWISVASIKKFSLHKYHFTVLTLAIRSEIHGKLSFLGASQRLPGRFPSVFVVRAPRRLSPLYRRTLRAHLHRIQPGPHVGLRP